MAREAAATVMVGGILMALRWTVQRAYLSDGQGGGSDGAGARTPDAPPHAPDGVARLPATAAAPTNVAATTAESRPMRSRRPRTR